MNRFQNWYKIQPPALRLLLTVNVVLYLLWQVLLRHFGFMNSFFLEYLALDVEFSTLFLKPWSLITYNFLHLGLGFGGFLHILFNMLWLYWIGKEYEELHGPHRLFAAYIIAGIGGGLLTLLLHAIFPTVSAFNGPVVGASASVLGIMMCVATLYPFKSVALFLLGNIRLLYIVLGWLVLEALFFLQVGLPFLPTGEAFSLVSCLQRQSPMASTYRPGPGLFLEWAEGVHGGALRTSGVSATN